MKKILVVIIVFFAFTGCAGKRIVEKKTETIYSVAVFLFKNTLMDKSIDNLKEGIAETITTQMVTSQRFKMVERTQLNIIMEEHRLDLTGIIDPETVKEIGKVLGVEFIVTGSFQKIGNRFKFEARFVETDTGIICGAETVTGYKTEISSLLRQLGEKLIKGFDPHR